MPGLPARISQPYRDRFMTRASDLLIRSSRLCVQRRPIDDQETGSEPACVQVSMYLCTRVSGVWLPDWLRSETWASRRMNIASELMQEKKETDAADL